MIIDEWDALFRERMNFDGLKDDVARMLAGDVLLVGINYDKKTKKHGCKIERAGIF